MSLDENPNGKYMDYKKVVDLEITVVYQMNPAEILCGLGNSHDVLLLAVVVVKTYQELRQGWPWGPESSDLG